MKLILGVDSFQSLLKRGKEKLDLEGEVFILRMGTRSLIQNEEDFAKLKANGEEILKFSTSPPCSDAEFDDLDKYSMEELEELLKDPNITPEFAEEIDEWLHLKEMQAGFDYLGSVLDKVLKRIEENRTE